jgi:hypothetical protein
MSKVAGSLDIARAAIGETKALRPLLTAVRLNKANMLVLEMYEEIRKGRYQFQTMMTAGKKWILTCW